MAFYWRLRKKDYYFTAIELQKRLRGLKNSSVDDIENDLRGTNLQFYYTESVSASLWIRLTLPFAFIVMIGLIIFMPINFMITGRWGYKWESLTNWFRAVGF